RLLRRGAALAGHRAVRAPAVRAAALLHPGRAALVRGHRRPARRHDDDPAAGGSVLTVIFRTRSDIEANIGQGLLESHGVDSVRTAGAPPGMFPFTVSTLGETRVSVRSEEAETAMRIIEAHREQVGGGTVVPLSQQFAPLEHRLGYRFRDRGLLEH